MILSIFVTAIGVIATAVIFSRRHARYKAEMNKRLSAMTTHYEQAADLYREVREKWMNGVSPTSKQRMDFDMEQMLRQSNELMYQKAQKFSGDGLAQIINAKGSFKLGETGEESK